MMLENRKARRELAEQCHAQRVGRPCELVAWLGWAPVSREGAEEQCLHQYLDGGRFTLNDEAELQTWIAEVEVLILTEFED